MITNEGKENKLLHADPLENQKISPLAVTWGFTVFIGHFRAVL